MSEFVNLFYLHLIIYWSIYFLLVDNVNTVKKSNIIAKSYDIKASKEKGNSE